MSVHDELTTVQRCLDDLVRSVGRLEKQLGSGSLEVRRVRSDANHLRESLALLRETAVATAGPAKRPDLVTISDTPTTRRCGWTPTTRVSAPATAAPLTPPDRRPPT